MTAKEACRMLRVSLILFDPLVSVHDDSELAKATSICHCQKCDS
jgi:hypothetical protein